MTTRQVLTHPLLTNVLIPAAIAFGSVKVSLAQLEVRLTTVEQQAVADREAMREVAADVKQLVRDVGDVRVVLCTTTRHPVVCR